MNTDTDTETELGLTPRDRAVLRAVAAGRCAYAAGALLVDGIGCCDQFVGPRLVRAGLIAAGGVAEVGGGAGSGPVRLTAAGRALLADAPIPHAA
ncbi:hypothetical protein [Saccharothrix xinjiangensis]|uniref:ArsR family transcriptional regulator n=1 Tax=Saccharothrix xinjiangensis TaxID=204798 RepID=A0ABV9YAP9_9PSEU